MVPRSASELCGANVHVPIFLLPNTIGLELAGSVEMPPSRVGWESFPPLVESLQDEKALPAHACSSSTTCIIGEKKARKSSVSFSNVQIREHAIIVGDHPCAESLPLSLDWAHTAEPKVVNLDAYEAMRAPHRRRRGSDMHLSLYERKNLLKRVGGLSERDIAREQRRAYFRDGINPPSLTMRRVETVAAMQAATVSAAHADHAHAVACSAINPGCPINGPTVTACV